METREKEKVNLRFCKKQTAAVRNISSLRFGSLQSHHPGVCRVDLSNTFVHKSRSYILHRQEEHEKSNTIPDQS